MGIFARIKIFEKLVEKRGQKAEDTPMENPRQEIENLRASLAEYERLYRLENAPAISDAQYDALMRRLRDLEARFPEFADADSPTQKVGDDSSAGFEKRAHLSRMLSLDNAFNFEDLKEFDARLQKALGKSGTLKYVVEPKIDGAGISAVYERGRLSRLLTRGNGAEGDDITKNLSVIKNIPRELKGGNVPELLEVRGEAYMLNSDFEKLRAAQEAELEGKLQKEFEGELSSGEKGDIAKQKSLYANPRNLASGTLKLLDRSVLATRALYATFYSIGTLRGGEVKRQSELAGYLESLGLPHMQTSLLAEGAEGAFEAIERLDTLRKAFDFNTDGAVVKLDDMSLYTLAGWTSKAPRWAIAWKYKPERAKVRIYQITLQVGRTGVVTPVAELEDAEKIGSGEGVLLSGSKVSRATLHNFDEISRKDVRVNDVALIEKAGEIIPAVVCVLPEYRAGDSVSYRPPSNCPACGEPLVRDEDEAALCCINPECPEQVRRRIIHFASRGCMDIDGLGEAVVTQLLERGLLKNFADIYSLTGEQLATLEGFKQKSVDNLTSAIEDSKGRDLWRLIFGLGIPYVGERVAKDLALEFKNLDRLISADAAALANVSGVGERIELSILDFFKSSANLRVIEKLRNSGVNFEARETSSSSEFAGKIFVLTGTLSSMGRSEAKRLIESYGGRVASGVSSSTDYLISSGENSTKQRKALELGIRILSEGDFLEMLRGASQNSVGNQSAEASSEGGKNSGDAGDKDSQLTFGF